MSGIEFERSNGPRRMDFLRYMTQHRPRLSGAREADLVATSVLAAVAFMLALTPVRDVDLFWHLAVGRHTAEVGLPRTNFWSYTAPEHPFAATSWLFDLAAYGLERSSGIKGLHLATATLVAVAFVLCFWLARVRGAGRTIALALVFAAVAASQTRFAPRPHVASYFFLVVELALLHHVLVTRRWWPLGILPLLVALWSNVHAGAVFGAAIAGCFAAGAWIDSRLRREHAPDARVRRWAVVCAAVSVFALMANPHGPELIRYAVFHLAEVDRVVQLAEFETPALTRYGAFWVLLAIIVAAGVIGRRRLTAYELLASALFAVGAVMAARLVPKFLLVAVPSAAAALEPAVASLAQRIRRPLVSSATTMVLPALSLVGALGLAPEPLLYFVTRIGVGTDPYRVAERAAAVVGNLGVTGRCFASWDLSGYIEWAFPDSPVHIDPRVRAYPSEIFAELERADESQEAFDEMVTRYVVAWAFRSHWPLRLSGVGRFRRDRWATLHWDEAAIVMLNRDDPRLGSRWRDLELRHFLPDASVVDSWRSLEGEARRRWLAEVERLARSPRLAPAHVGLCLEYARTGRLKAAEDACRQAQWAIGERERFYPLEGRNWRRDAGVAHAVLAMAVFRDRGKASAAPLLEAARDLAPENHEVLAAVGAGYLPFDPAAARRAFESALRLRPGWPVAIEGLERAKARGASSR